MYRISFEYPCTVKELTITAISFIYNAEDATKNFNYIYQFNGDPTIRCKNMERHTANRHIEHINTPFSTMLEGIKKIFYPINTPVLKFKFYLYTL